LGRDFDTSFLKDAGHRPWKMPESPWLMTQTWRDLLFAHWRIDPQLLRAKVPSQFPLDLFDGDAWIGVVPFRMTNVGPRGLRSLPGVSEFPELNVRTYVRVGDKPGVYFFSLDAGNWLAVQAARTVLNLPYYRAAMRVRPVAGAFAYESRRLGGAAEFAATYEPDGDVFVPTAGSLESFLTERYCLYNLDRRGVPYRLDIHHPRWSLQPAKAHLTRNTMTDVAGIALPDQLPLLLFASRQDAVAWAPRPLNHGRD
jgi:uncharacterized protein YqjF (DUF2071 family)